MRKILLTTVVFVGLLVIALPGSATAADFIGQFCWNKSPFIDVIKLSVSSGGSQFELHGSQAVPDLSYKLPFVGNAFVAGTSVTLAGLFAGDGINFAGCKALATYGTLNLATLTSSQTLNGVGCAFGPSVSTWVPIACPPGPAGATPHGAAEGAQ